MTKKRAKELTKTMRADEAFETGPKWDYFATIDLSTGFWHVAVYDENGTYLGKLVG